MEVQEILTQTSDYGGEHIRAEHFDLARFSSIGIPKSRFDSKYVVKSRKVNSRKRHLLNRKLPCLSFGEYILEKI